MQIGNLLLNRLHRGEQQHVTDRCTISKQHHQTIHAEAQTARGGQAVLQCVDVVVVHLCLALGLQRLALGHLTLEAALLVDGVVQLAEGVAVLGAVDEILEALGEGGIIRLALCQRADLDGIIVDEGGLDELVLDEGVEELGQDGTLGVGTSGSSTWYSLAAAMASSSVFQSLKSTPEYFLTASIMVRRSQWPMSICLP